eukprot:1157925-Pelagomonas_calceolata.AAC.6
MHRRHTSQQSDLGNGIEGGPRGAAMAATPAWCTPASTCTGGTHRSGAMQSWRMGLRAKHRGAAARAATPTWCTPACRSAVQDHPAVLGCSNRGTLRCSEPSMLLPCQHR